MNFAEDALHAWANDTQSLAKDADAQLADLRGLIKDGLDSRQLILCLQGDRLRTEFSELASAVVRQVISVSEWIPSKPIR